jgi:pimeloyl-ACP methyl ester carboxylesterase
VKRILWIAGGVLLALVVIAYTAGSWYFSSVILDSPTMTLEESRDRELIREPAEYGLPQPADVVIDTGEVQLAGWFFDNERDGRCAALILHGYTDTRYGALQYTPLFWERGCDLLLYDARDHGVSSQAYHTFGFCEKADGIAALNWLAERTGLERNQIALVGISYGAATVLQMLPLAPDVALVLADSSYESMSDIIGFQGRQAYGTLAEVLLPGSLLISELRADFDVEQVSPADAVIGVETPIFLLHSLQDEFTPASHSEVIFANSDPENTELHLTDWGAEHGLSIIEDFAAYQLLFDDFLAEKAPDFGLPGETP